MPPKAKPVKQEEKQSEGISKIDIVLMIASLIMLFLFIILLFILYKMYDTISKQNTESTAIKAIDQLIGSINNAKNDEHHIHLVQTILKSLENETLSQSLYGHLVNVSAYNSLLYGIEVRSTICNNKIQRKAVNHFSKLLIKMLTSGGYAFPCNTKFIVPYLSQCYSSSIPLRSLFRLIRSMIHKKCQNEAIESLYKASKIKESFSLRFRILEFIESANQTVHSIKNHPSYIQNEEGLICELAESSVERLAKSSIVEEEQNKFCAFVKTHNCSVFEESTVVTLCSNENKEL